MLIEPIPLLEREKQTHELFLPTSSRRCTDLSRPLRRRALWLNRTLEIARSSRDQNAEVIAQTGLALPRSWQENLQRGHRQRT